MTHLAIILKIGTLIIGVIINYYFFNLYKSGKGSFVKSLFIYMLLTNMILLIDLLKGYEILNLDHQYLYETTLGTIASWGLIILWAGTMYVVAMILAELFGKVITRKYSIAFVFAAIVIGFIHEAGLVNYYFDNAYIHICTSRGFKLTPIFLIIVVLVSGLIYNRKTKPVSSKVNIRVFVLLFLVGYTLYFVFSVLKMNREFTLLLAGLFLNLSLIFWFKRYYLPNAVITHPLKDKELLDIFRERFDISKRELEVLTLMLQGKKNKEIETVLFISASTIKNHVASLYKKIGINSRGQLMNLVIKFQRGE